MISLLSMNIGFVKYRSLIRRRADWHLSCKRGSCRIVLGHQPEASTGMYETSWWMHILLIFLFANMLPYSKHFHVFMSVPNVFLSRLEPLGKLPNMDSITREVKLMLNPDTAFAAATTAMLLLNDLV
jgi:hypothetical protein